MRQSSDLSSFLLELRDLCNHALADPPGGASAAPLSTRRLDLTGLRASYSRRLLQELDALGWDTVRDIDLSLSNLRLSIRDSSKREHTVRVKLPPKWPQAPAVCQLDIPEPPPGRDDPNPSESIDTGPRATSSRVHVDMSSRSSNSGDVKSSSARATGFKRLVSDCRAVLDSFDAFWAVIEDLDASLCILEPSAPVSRACTRRRIAVKRHCSMQIDISPTRPRALPEVRFLGAESVTAPLVSRLNSKVWDWDTAKLPRENLESILGISFPSPQTSKIADFDMECGICYAYRLQQRPTTGPPAKKRQRVAAAQKSQDDTKQDLGLAPDKMCDNAKCGRPFHRACLCEWLRSIPNTTQSFNTLFGSCPYCQSPITVDVSLV